MRDRGTTLKSRTTFNEIAAVAKLPRKDGVLDCFVAEAPRKDIKRALPRKDV